MDKNSKMYEACADLARISKKIANYAGYALFQLDHDSIEEMKKLHEEYRKAYNAFLIAAETEEDEQ